MRNIKAGTRDKDDLAQREVKSKPTQRGKMNETHIRAGLVITETRNLEL